MSKILKKIARKSGVALRGGLRPILDRWKLQQIQYKGLDYQSVANAGYFSQHGQDKWVVEKIFKNQREGIFVDIGAYNGIEISNTYYLEEKLNWKGICVEPIPKLYNDLCKNRKCICVNGCVAAVDGEVEFLEVEGSETLSGLERALDKTQDDRIQNQKINKLKLPGYNLNTLLKLHQFENIDFLSIDTEGSEMEILKSISWGDVSIKVICVENTYYGDLLAEFMYDKGYMLNAVLNGDEIYVHKNCKIFN